MGEIATIDTFVAADAKDSSTGERRRPSIKRVALAGLALLALAASALYGRYWWDTGRFIESTDDAYVGGDVTVIAPRVSGIVSAVMVRDNQRVRAGDLLIRLDDRDYRAALTRAEASVASQDAALLNLAATRRLQDAIIGQRRAELAGAMAEAARTHSDADRYRQLSEKNYASEQRFQQADADDKKAAAAVTKARAALDAAELEIAVIDTRKRQTTAARMQALAEREAARLNLGYTEVHAPRDGFIGNRSARVGSYATPGAGMIALVPTEGLWVDANFKESQLADMRPGQSVSVVADILPGETFTGRVESLAPATGAQFSVLPPENATGNFTKIVQRVPVRVLLDGESGRLGRLRPGLSVTASVDRRGGSQDGGAPSLRAERVGSIER